MICVTYKKKLIDSICSPGDKNTVVGFSGYFVEIWTPKPTTVIFTTLFISHRCKYF